MTTTNDQVQLWQSTGPVAVWDEAVGSPLLAWLAGPGAILQVLDDLIRDGESTPGTPPLTPDDDILPGPSLIPTDGSPAVTNAPGWSLLLDVDRCPIYALPWLGQFVGVRLAPTLDPTLMRDMIRQEQGFQRGTVAALRAAAAPFLTDPTLLVITERTPDPYSFAVSVPATDLKTMTWNELAAGYPTWDDVAVAFPTWDDFGSAAEQLEAALLAAKPAGLVMTFATT